MGICLKDLLLDSTKQDLKNFFDRERQYLSLSKEYKAKTFLGINPFFSTDAYPHLGLDLYVDLLPSSGEVATKTLQEYVDEYEWEHVVAEEEKALWESYKKYPLWALIAFGFWLP